jgi:RimJ/RimL family protein N-acetyltransferase
MPATVDEQVVVERALAAAGAVGARASDWRQALPVLTGPTGHLTLRELRLSDARSLMTLLTTEEVSRFISPPPSTIDGFERFILWAQRERAAGNYICFGVVPEGSDVAVGLFQIRRLEPDFAAAEWGFAIGSSFWGSGLFVEGARLVGDFAFDVLGVHRLEARAAVLNGRGNAALKKLGASRECLLRQSFLLNGEYLDQVLWTIVDDDWRARRVPSNASSIAGAERGSAGFGPTAVAVPENAGRCLHEAVPVRVPHETLDRDLRPLDPQDVEGRLLSP